MQLFNVSARVEKHGIFSDRELSDVLVSNEQAAKEMFSEYCSANGYKIIGEIITEQLISSEAQDAPKPKKPKAKKGK